MVDDKHLFIDDRGVVRGVGVQTPTLVENFEQKILKHLEFFFCWHKKFQPPTYPLSRKISDFAPEEMH